MDKDKLFRAIQMYGFAIDEIKLYLDTHPNCRNALDFYHRYNDLRREAEEEYIRLYGPLTANQVKSEITGHGRTSLGHGKGALTDVAI